MMKEETLCNLEHLRGPCYISRIAYIVGMRSSINVWEINCTTNAHCVFSPNFRDTQNLDLNTTKSIYIIYNSTTTSSSNLSFQEADEDDSSSSSKAQK